MSRPPVPVTVVIAARNEAEQIASCIESVSWAADVLVVEYDSTDDTVARATAAGATVFQHPFRTIAGQRNAAIARAQQPWILVVDADERGTPALGEAVRAAIEQPGGLDAFRVRRRNFLLGREVRHGGWERDRPVRLFRQSLRYEERAVHEHVVVNGPVGELTEPLLHTPYASLDEYFEKLRRYSRWWAEQHAARGRRARVSDLVLRPAGRLFTMLVLRGGWRDGPIGVLVAVLGAISVAAKYAQLYARGLERSR
ncbi:MAG TPA: glycosyltransferase family 2 protein [Gemmatimonadaceae bacterium]